MPWVESLKSKPTVCARRSQPNLPRGSQMVVLRTLVEIHIECSRLFNLYQSSHVWPPRCQGWSNSSCTSAPCNVQRPGRFQFWSLTRQAPRSAPRGRDSSGTGGPNEFCSFDVLLPHFVTTLPIKDGGATFSVCESEDDDSFNSVLFRALLELLKPIITHYIYILYIYIYIYYIYIYYIYLCAHHLSGGIIAVAYSSVPLAHECGPLGLGTRSY